MKLPPCKDCKERNAECHANCDKYAEWSDQHQVEREKKREADRALFIGSNKHFRG